jgi:hypothetical protein
MEWNGMPRNTTIIYFYLHYILLRTSMTYDIYSNYVGFICAAKKLGGFKSHPSYTYMLEHVSKQQGQAYLECIFAGTAITKDEVVAFCDINDANGSPQKEHYDALPVNVSVSPSSLRYIYHAHLILAHMKSLGDGVGGDIVELGGGYGGLCLAVHHFAPSYGICIRSYTICDLTNIIQLQKLYLNAVKPELKVEFVDASTYGATITRDKMFLISNYCFSEIAGSHQALYRQLLFPKIANGFMVWNYIPVYDLGIGNLRSEPEIPLTGAEFNRYVWF